VFTFKTRAGFAKVSRSTEQLLMTTDKKNIVLRDKKLSEMEDSMSKRVVSFVKFKMKGIWISFATLHDIYN